MERQSQIKATIITTLTVIIAGAAVIYWLRGVDLPQMAKFRLLAGLMVVCAGYVGGIIGRRIGREMRPQLKHPLMQKMALAGFGVIALVLIANFSVAVWRVSEKMPAPDQRLMNLLSNLLFLVFIACCLGMLGWMVVRGEERRIKGTLGGG